jgi:hypothetical protein
MVYEEVHVRTSAKLEQSMVNFETEIFGSDDDLRVSSRAVGVAVMVLSQLRTRRTDGNENMLEI